MCKYSVATVMTNVFHKNGIMVSGKLAKIVRIFVDIGHIKNQRVIYRPERIGRVIPTLWSGHDFSHEFWPKLWPLHSVGITGPILSGQYMTPRFMMCPMSTNILTILANFPDTIIPFLWKTSVMTVATPEERNIRWDEQGGRELLLPPKILSYNFILSFIFQTQWHQHQTSNTTTTTQQWQHHQHQPPPRHDDNDDYHDDTNTSTQW